MKEWQISKVIGFFRKYPLKEIGHLFAFLGWLIRRRNMMPLLLTDSDRQIIYHIEVDIMKHPDRYKKAGEWMDEFYGIESYWERMIDIHEVVAGSRSDFMDFPSFSTTFRLMSIAIVSAMVTVSRVKRYKEYFKEERKLPRKDHESSIQKYLEWHKQNKTGIAIYERFEFVVEGLLFPMCRSSFLLEIEEARRILLATWLLTCANADKANLGITKFEQWPWDGHYDDRQAPYLFYKVFQSTTINRMWIKGMREAYAKLQAEKKIALRPPEEKIEAPELDKIDQKIVAMYQEAERQTAANPKSKLRLPGSRKIASALYKSGITSKKYSHEAIRKRIKKLKNMGLIGHPDDNADPACRLTNENIADFGAEGKIKQKL